MLPKRKTGPLPALDDLFAPERVAHFTRELAVEPAQQPACFRPLFDRAPHKRDLRIGLFEIFFDRPAVADDAVAVDEHRRFGGGIELEEPVLHEPGLDLDQFAHELLFAQRDRILRE